MGSDSHPKILVVDDDSAVLRLLRIILSEEGYDSEFARDGEEAWSRLLSESFSLLLTDLQMPGRSGLDIIRGLRRRGFSTPVVLLSGALTSETLEETATLGGVTCMAKPLDLGSLRATLKRLLSKRQPNSESRCVP
jgi:DNA-binding response OmpR family regulator